MRNYCDRCNKLTKHEYTGIENESSAVMKFDTFLDLIQGNIEKPKGMWKQISCSECGMLSWRSDIK